MLIDRLFTDSYGAAPELIARAPGRVNLIGEHTDYNDGFVLPFAIDRHTLVAAKRRTDRQLNVVAGDFGQARVSFALDTPILPDAAQPWSNYIRGVAAGLLAHGVPLTGADLAILGDVPQGAGLSSSAALEVAVGYALTKLTGQEIDRTTLALIAQRAEHDFAGCQCGVMDQLVSARGVAGHALLIDCRSLSCTPVHIPPEAAVLIVHSGVQRGLVDGEYNTRRMQCELGARHFGVAHLRDVSESEVERSVGTLEPTVFRRARHVVSENARTLAAVEALKSSDLVGLGRLMAQSHDSMRDDFEITTPEIDRLVTLLQRQIGEHGGARMTGGGFGGAVIAVCASERVAGIAQYITEAYRTPLGAAPEAIIPGIASGCSEL